MGHVLRVENLVKQFSSGWFWQEKEIFTAVRNISFHVNEGEILGFLGPNGAGKTTTIQMLLGTLTPTSGLIDYFGQDFFVHRSEVMQQVSFASTYVRLPARLTVLENLQFYAHLYGISSRESAMRIEKFLTFFGMWELRNRRAGALSAGETTRVMLAKAFIAYPKIVLLDEPTAALDPDVAYAVRDFVKMQRDEYGVSILFTSHNMAEVADVCDRVLVLRRGEIIANNTPQELAASVSLARLHLRVESDCAAVERFMKQHAFNYCLQGTQMWIDVDEHAIAQLLQDISAAGITYSHILIDRPTLEDYFIQLVKQPHHKG